MDPHSEHLQVLRATSYLELPSRRIISSPFFEKPLRSYGIVAYCEETKKWLLVQRQHTPEFIITMRGSYRCSDIPRLVAGYSNLEFEKIQALLQSLPFPCSDRCSDRSGHNNDYGKFPSLFRATISNSERDLLYGAFRFFEVAPIFRIECQKLHYRDTNLRPEWLWPKGRMHAPPVYKHYFPREQIVSDGDSHDNRIKKETPFRCALREFSEETGITIHEGMDTTRLISTTPLTESFRGSNGRIYETTCWVCVFPHSINPPPIPDQNIPGEIGDCKWVTEEEAHRLLSDSKYMMLREARKLIEDSSITATPTPIETTPVEIKRKIKCRHHKISHRDVDNWQVVTRRRH